MLLAGGQILDPQGLPTLDEEILTRVLTLGGRRPVEKSFSGFPGQCDQ